MGVGRNLAYKKSLFFKNKGFASHINITSGDDDLFIQEVAKKIMYILKQTKKLIQYHNLLQVGKNGSIKKEDIFQPHLYINLNLNIEINIS